MDKQILRTYKFRVLPTKQQEEMFSKYFGCVRFVYNHFLSERKKQYDKSHKSDSYNKQSKRLTELKKQVEYAWLNEINSQTLQHSLRHLETAYVNFFRGTTKFPQFKSKKSKNTFFVPQFCRIEGNKLIIPKFKDGIKFIEHRKVKGSVKSMTFSKTPTGKYFVSILTQETYIPFKKTNKSVGVDLGLKNFVTTSDGQKYKNIRTLKKYEKKLKQAQQHLSRKVKGSNSYENQRRKVALLHEKITNVRTDYLHKISTDIIKKYDVICLETLDIKRMVKNHRLAKIISDASWGEFVSMLDYKAEMNDKIISKIDRWYPSSKSCCCCGYIKQDLGLKDRIWTCPNCGETHDRDINASINILSEGLKNISVGTIDYTNGDGVRLKQKHLSMKLEAPKSLV